MAKVDAVLVGAEGVVETGGIVNHVGTFQAALCAHEMRVPFYVAVETHKFVRMFPLDQYDLGESNLAGFLKDESMGVAIASEMDALPIHSASPESSCRQEEAPATPYNMASKCEAIVAEMRLSNPTLDYTPPKFISLLFTDKGALAPAAISDELLRVFL
jgi:translation initiation factor eIF-2B subunit alpha